MHKEHQVLAHLTSATLERLHACTAVAVEVDRCTDFIQLLEAASLDVLDESLARADLGYQWRSAENTSLSCRLQTLK